ncbi:hypothetical protein [Nostoc sp. 'Peltigera membranacea cyanobiont' 210A]|uniref:hypothetical protein n=1 Tax=Nostoc sp. 'Peltigera membranacea cyanobiont' 210A TaxID=2014529 RepID=UPI001180147C|nr:hypothetical protein [Nostoc sp. 'Peltigera membranacea cyanobiont' 210A]
MAWSLSVVEVQPLVEKYWSYQVRLITSDYRICAKIPKASSPSKNCGLNDKSLTGHDIIGHWLGTNDNGQMTTDN